MWGSSEYNLNKAKHVTGSSETEQLCHDVSCTTIYCSLPIFALGDGTQPFLSELRQPGVPGGDFSKRLPQKENSEIDRGLLLDRLQVEEYLRGQLQEEGF